MSDRMDDGENLNQIYSILRRTSTEVVLDRHAMGPLRKLHAEITESIREQYKADQLEAIVPDGTERNAYLDAAQGDLRAAITAAQRAVQPATLRSFIDAGLTADHLASIVWSNADVNDAVRRFDLAANAARETTDARRTP